MSSDHTGPYGTEVTPPTGMGTAVIRDPDRPLTSKPQRVLKPFADAS